MATETISFSTHGNGWNSFHSWNPDCMVGMNNNFYTFKNGSLWKHNTNSSYGTFYDTFYNSSAEVIFNDSSDDVKMFKTIALDSSTTWKADITTDLTNGIVERAYYKQKEGSYFSYIRRDPNTVDTVNISTQGIGTVLSYSALVLTFGFVITASISIGDKLYRINGGSLELIGTVASHTNKTITISGAPAVTPVDGVDVIAVVKDSTAESNGIRGSKMKVKLINDDASSASLFAVYTEINKSHQ